MMTKTLDEFGSSEDGVSLVKTEAATVPEIKQLLPLKHSMMMP